MPAPTQSSAVQSFPDFGGSTTTRTVSLTGVTSNASIIVIVSGAYFSSAPTWSVDSGNYSPIHSNTYTGSGKFFVAFFRRDGVSAGSHSIPVTFSGPAYDSVYADVRAYEISGLAPGAPDKLLTGGNTNSNPTTDASGTLTQASNMVIAAVSSQWAGIDTPASFTNIYLDDNASGTPPNSHDWRDVSSTSSLSVSWGTLDVSGDWVAAAVVLKLVAALTGSGSPASGTTAITGTGGITSPVIRPFISPVTGVRVSTTSVSGSGTVG